MNLVPSGRGDPRCVRGDFAVPTVKLPAGEDIVKSLRDVVFEKVSRALPANVISSTLRVYADRAAYDTKQKEEDNAPIGTRGESLKNALIVEVTPSNSEKRSYDEVSTHAVRDFSEQSALTLADLMAPVDKGWTASWLIEFRKSQIAPHNLPLVRERAEFIEHESSVKITLHERIRDKWMTKMKTPSSELMEKIFRVANSEPCVEFVNEIGNRVVQSVDPGDTEISFFSF